MTFPKAFWALSSESRLIIQEIFLLGEEHNYTSVRNTILPYMVSIPMRAKLFSPLSFPLPLFPPPSFFTFVYHTSQRTAEEVTHSANDCLFVDSRWQTLWWSRNEQLQGRDGGRLRPQPICTWGRRNGRKFDIISWRTVEKAGDSCNGIQYIVSCKTIISKIFFLWKVFIHAYTNKQNEWINR